MERTLAASGPRWAIATPHTAATDAGAAAFKAGGNAVDAALAAAVTLAVVYPHMCGVGGDLFALVAEPGGAATAINGSGAAPAGIDPDALRARGGLMPETGPDSITVPGAVSGWAALAERGRLPLAAAFERAIVLARKGVPVARDLASAIASAAGSAAGACRDIYSPGGRPPAEGEPLLQPALAQTLEAIRDGGAEALYAGEIGAAYAEGMRAAGSALTLEDLRAHRAEPAAPLHGPLGDLEVLVAPPNSQGFVLLEILGMLPLLDAGPDPLGSDAALLAEAFRLASADRDRYNADPRLADVPLDMLLSKNHLRTLCTEARAGGAPTPPASPPRVASGDTIALVAADSDGYAVSLIQSLYSSFGSGILEASTGIVAHNRGSMFSLDPTSPNVLQGGKRPAHTLMPVLVRRDGRIAAVSGTMGGGAQPQINAMNLIRMFVLDHSPAEAIAAPRWAVGGTDPDASARFIEVEPGVPGQTRDTLARTYQVEPVADGIGHAHLILVDEGGFTAASDPRADGSAAAG